MRVRITENMIEKLKPGEVAKDTLVRGLSVRRTATGATWVVWYRPKGSRTERRPSIGQWPLMPTAEARDKARKMLGEVAAGSDPSQERAAALAAPKIEDLVDEMTKSHFPRIKKRSRESYRHGLAVIAKALPGRRLASIKRSEVIKLHFDMAATPIKANRMLSALSKAWSIAEQLEWVPVGSNPAKGIERYPEPPRRRLPTETELRKIAELVRQKQLTHPDHTAALMLIIMTGARARSEIIKAQAEWVTPLGLQLPDSKTGFKVVPLPDAARRIIADLGKTAGRLFPFGERAFCDWWDDLRREAGAPDLWLHDLRRLFASVGLGSGLSLGQIGGVLGHSSEATTKRYAWMQTAPATRVAEAISSEIATAMLPAPAKAPEPSQDA